MGNRKDAERCGEQLSQLLKVREGNIIGARNAKFTATQSLSYSDEPISSCSCCSPLCHIKIGELHSNN